MPSIIETLLRPEIIVPNGLCLVGIALGWLSTSSLRRRPHSNGNDHDTPRGVPDSVMMQAQAQRDKELVAGQKKAYLDEQELARQQAAERTVGLTGDALVKELARFRNQQAALRKKNRKNRD